MTMRPMHPTRAALLVLSLAYASAALADEHAPYPIWWSSELELVNLEQIDALLAEPFRQHRQFEVRMSERDRLFTDERIDPSKPELGYIRRPEKLDAQAALITNCRSFIEWADRRFVPTNNSAEPVFEYYATYCYALDILKGARPARISYVENFKFNDEAMDFLPVLIGEMWWCGRLEAFLEANREEVPWSKFPYYINGLGEPTYRLSVEDENTIHVEDLYQSETNTTEVYSRASIAILGRGDFDDDGYEDLLVRWQFETLPIYGVPMFSALYLLSRRQDDAVLRATDYIGPALGLSGCNERNLIRESGSFE